LSLLAGRRLDAITCSADDVARVRALAERGVVVWVHRSRNPIDHLALSRVALREGLPWAAFVGGLNVLALQSLPAALSRVRRGFASVRQVEQLLARCVQEGHAAELFLRRPLHLLSTTSTVRPKFVETLIGVQRALDRPIFLVPVFLALRQRPGHFEPTAVDALLGSVEEPGLLRAMGRLMAAGDSARLELSEAVDLRAFVSERAHLPDAVLAKKVRWTVLHHLARVERVAHGPPLKSHPRLREDVLRDPRLQQTMALVGDEQKTTLDVVEHKARALYDEIAARFDVDIARFLDRVLQAAWRRIYDAIVVDEAEIERVRQAARKGPLVLVPSHRSHVDYLVMSQVMLHHGMLPPHIAAGDNLSFFPLGPILRRGGAFFLRRSFKGDALYGAVFRAYVRRLFKEGLTTEFFIEGGRARNGKTLPPRLGLLSMLVEAWLESREDDAIFVPAHIAYEKIVEAKSYTRELGGAAKEKESAAGLMKATGVLAGRYGKVFVTFDEPLSLRAHMAERGITRDVDVDDPRVRAAIAALGHRIAWGINQAGVVTAMSLVCATLFGFRKKGLEESVLFAGAHAMLSHVQRQSRARFEAGLKGDSASVLLRGALEKIVADGLVTRTQVDQRTFFAVTDGAWLILDVHKNHVVHHSVPEAIVALALFALRAVAGTPVARSAVAQQAKEISRALKLEFIFEPGVAFERLFDAAVADAAAAGFVVVRADDIVVPAEQMPVNAWHFAANLLRGFVECYAVVVGAAPRILADIAGAEEKAAVLRFLQAVQAGVVAGDVGAAEAASKVVVENAVALMVERGFVLRDGKVLRLAPEHEAERVALLDLLRRCIG
jgi:glycerol-3-phosphate O-acyltransferase